MTEREPRAPERADCDRFTELLESRLLGDPTRAQALEWMDAHAAGCDACRALHASTRVLPAAPEPAPDQVQAMAERALQSFEARQRERQRRWWLGGGAASLAAAAAALVLWLGPAQPGRGPAAGAGEQLAAVSPAEVTERILSPDTRMVFFHGARYAFEREAPDDVALRLQRGGVYVEDRMGSRGGHLSVSTDRCTVTVVGTRFAVEVLAQDVRVDVLEGEVDVTAPGWERPRRVGAGQQLWAAQAASGPMEAARRALLQGWAAPDAEAPLVAATLEPAAPEPAAAGPSAVEVEPVAPSPGVGDEAEPAGASERKAARRRGERRQGRRAQPAAGAAEAAEASPSWQETGSTGAGSGPTARELLDRARECQLRQDHEGASSAYRELLRRHPSSSLATTALVPLGELELTRLGQTRSALRRFDTYLRQRPDGAMAAEALYGKCRALRALGDAEGEQRAIRQFLQRYPSHVRAPQLRGRLPGGR